MDDLYAGVDNDVIEEIKQCCNEEVKKFYGLIQIKEQEFRKKSLYTTNR